MSKLNTNQVGLSLAIVFAIIYILCAILVAILPLQTIITYSNYVMHGIDITTIAAKTISPVGLIIGIIEIFVLGYIAGALFAFFYNWLGKKIK